MGNVGGALLARSEAHGLKPYVRKSESSAVTAKTSALAGHTGVNGGGHAGSFGLACKKRLVVARPMMQQSFGHLRKAFFQPLYSLHAAGIQRTADRLRAIHMSSKKTVAAHVVELFAKFKNY